jgi:hypothetical protein
MYPLKVKVDIIKHLIILKSDKRTLPADNTLLGWNFRFQGLSFNLY